MSTYYYEYVIEVTGLAGGWPGKRVDGSQTV